MPAVPCKLSGSLPAGDVLGVWTAPNSARVVFLHRDATLKNHLYSAPVAGGAAAVKLDAAATQSAGFLAISADSTRVLYTGVVAGGARALFSVPIGGPATAGVRLAGAVGSGFTDARISPDSRKVVYLPPSRDRLLAVPIAGPSSAAGRLTDPVVAGGSILDFAISAGSGSVVYRPSRTSPAPPGSTGCRSRSRRSRIRRRRSSARRSAPAGTCSTTGSPRTTARSSTGPTRTPTTSTSCTACGSAAPDGSRSACRCPPAGA